MWQKYCLEIVSRLLFYSTVSYTVSHSAKYKLDSYEIHLFIYYARTRTAQHHPETRSKHNITILRNEFDAIKIK